MTIPKRTLIIGDIHGCFDELSLALDYHNYNPNTDRIISTGDLVHKGPYSAKVLEFFYENSLEFVLGNHDKKLLDMLEGKRPPYDEGEKILSELSLSKITLREWLSEAPLFIKGEEMVVVHAALDPRATDPLSSTGDFMYLARYLETSSGTLIESAEPPIPPSIVPWYEQFDTAAIGKRAVVFGHWARPHIRVRNNCYCLDTGCCYGGALTTLTIPDFSLSQIQSTQPKLAHYR